MSEPHFEPALTKVIHFHSKAINSGAEIAATSISEGMKRFGGLQSHLEKIEPKPVALDALWSSLRYRVENTLLGWGFSETITPTAYCPTLRRGQTDLVHLHNTYNSGMRIADIKRLCKQFPLVWTIHDGRWVCWDENPRVGHKKTLRTIGARVLFWRLRNASDNCKVVFPSSWLRRKAIDKKLFPEENTSVIPTPVSVEFFNVDPTAEEVRMEWGFDLSSPLVLFVSWKAWKKTGDLNKGYDLIEKAIPEIRKSHRFQFVILGHDGLDIPEHLKAIWIEPDGTAKQVAHLMKAADFVIGASRQEGLGNVIQEAHAVGTPAVVSNSTGYLEIVDDGLTGLHFQSGNVQDLVDKSCQLLGNTQMRRVMSSNAAEKALRLWHPQVVVRQYRDLYKEAVRTWHLRTDS